jgi:hypothetical protein
MFRKILLRMNKRTSRFVAIGVLLFLVVVLFPFPIDEEHLTNGTGMWCTPSVPIIRWCFPDTGKFYYQAVSSDGGGGIASYGNKQGTWKLKGATINVVLDNNNRAFTIRPLLWGRLLWATDGFGEDIGVDVVGVPIWGKC